jgi:hypothetical protein
MTALHTVLKQVAKNPNVFWWATYSFTKTKSQDYEKLSKISKGKTNDSACRATDMTSK